MIKQVRYTKQGLPDPLKPKLQRNPYHSRGMVMKYLLTFFSAALLFLASVASLTAQNKDSIEGDFEALQALYHSTQGEDLPTLSSSEELPDVDEATYPFMYMIDGEIWWVKFSRTGDFLDWNNAGSPWKDSTGWGDMTPSTMGGAVGVTVDDNGRVIEVDMQKITTREGSSSGILTDGNNLVGLLPPELGNLKMTKKFNVKQNFLYGVLPDELGLMQEMERLSLAGHHWEIDLDNSRLWLEADHMHYNRNGGSDPYSYSVGGKGVPETNRFTGNLPEEIGDLHNLDLIELSHQFFTGMLPENWGNLTNLRGLLVDKPLYTEDYLYSTVPQSWDRMVKMKYFRINGGNKNPTLFGNLPDGMNLWNDLVNLSIFGNELSGEFPSFENVTELFYFNIANNNFSGEFPWGSIFSGNNSSINKFSISKNNFSGQLPETIPAASYPVKQQNGHYRLADINISANSFSGNVPNWIQEIIGLQAFNISDNNFTGPFPEKVMDQDNLKTFRIQNNELSGTLPDKEWPTNRISWFRMHNNNFEGEIPDSWQTLFQNEDGSWNTDRTFQRYTFENNNFSGRVPDWAKNVNWGSSKLHSFNGNRYTFKDIADAYEELKDVFGEAFKVSDQKPFGSPQTRTMPVGEDLILDLSEYHHEGNSYQWLKNGEPISGEHSAKLLITSLSNDDEGVYELEVTHSGMPELGKQVSEPITFTIGVNDGLNGGSNDENDGDNSGSDDGDTNNGNGNSPDFPSASILHGPDNDSEGQSLTPEFSWSDNGADYYILHVSRLNPTGMQIDVIVEDTTYTPDEILDDSTIHDWRVRGVKDGEPGEWSEIRRFTTGGEGLPDVAELISPGHYEQEVHPAVDLVWEDVGADSYEIRLWNKRNEEILYSDVSSTASYTPADALPDTTEFIWQVKSISGGLSGAWGPRWEFSTGVYTYITEPPSLIAPDPGSEYDNLTPVFEWSQVDADHYVISVTLEEPSNAKTLPGLQNESAIIFDETTETQYLSPDALEPETRYYWRVQAVKNGEEGEWSETWEFITADQQQNVSTEIGEQPLKTSLAQNYPNPFNPSTQIEFTLSTAQNVTLRVYDMAGRQVATLAEGVIQAGRHIKTFNADHLASGIYLYRFVSDRHHFTRKMTLVK